jgi:hypothetical protein
MNYRNFSHFKLSFNVFCAIRAFNARYVIGLICLILGFSQASHAQKIKITGRVLDDLNEEALPFSSVYLKGTTTGTVTDFDGYFTLNVDRLADSLIVTAVGYKMQAKHISNTSEQILNYRLKREAYMMDEIVVTAGENPAHRIMRKIVANKEKHNINNLESYQYETYNKLEIDLFDISEKFMDRKLFKPFKFIFENVDSVSEEKPFLPMFLTETLSDYYYSKSEGKKEVIRANRIAGEAKNESITQFLGNMYQKIDIYNNFMPIMGKNIPSPLCDGWKGQYEYYLLDSTTVNNRWSYKIRFKPKMAQQNAFEGDFWVADSTWAVQRINMELQAKEANINFMNRLSVYQEYTPITNEVWALKKDKLVIDFVASKDSPGLIGRKSTYFKDFVTNNDKIAQVLANGEELEVAADVYDKDERFWLQARHDSLSKNEKQVYAMIDTMRKMPIVRTYIDIVTLVVSGYKTVGKFDIGPYFKLLSYNQVDSWRTRIGFRTNKKLSERFQIESYVAYGFKSHEIHYGASILTMINRKPRQTLKIGYQDDKDIESRSNEDFGQDNILSGLIRNQKIPQKLIHEKTATFNYGQEWKKGITNDLSFVYTQRDPYFHAYFFDPNANVGDAPDSSFNTAEIKLNTRLAFNEKFVEGKFKRTSLGSKYPITNITYTYGFKGFGGSKLTYHKIELNSKDFFHVGSIGYTEWNLTAGKIFGTLPFYLLETFPGNETYFYNDFSFNRLNEYEFIADTYATLFLSHHFEGFFLNRIPLLRKLKLRELISGRIAVGSIDPKNVQANTDPTGTYKQFAGMAGLENWTPQAPEYQKPYIEVSAGIENILRLFRVDIVWRLTHNDKPQRPALRAGLQLTF